MDWLIGKTGHSFLDYWTIPHLAFWVVVGSTLAAFRLHRGFALLCCLLVAFGWELFEVFAHKKWPSVWESPESWLNSWVSDPLTVVLGLGIAFYGFDRLRK